MKHKIFRYGLPAIDICLLVVALWVLHRETANLQFSDITRELAALPRHHVAFAFAFTALSYLLLGGYDCLAIIFIGSDLPWRRSALTGSIAYAFSNTIGLSWLSGSSVRYRLYTSWGLSPLQIAKIVGFGALTFWIGWVGIIAFVFLWSPPAIPDSLGLPFSSARPVGFIAAGLTLVYLLVAAGKRIPPLERWRNRFPGLRLSLAQIVVASADLAVAAAALYSLLPETAGLHFGNFLAIYLLAMIAGLLSQMPGGLGVFESLMVVCLEPTIPAETVLGAILAFRAIYYILPLLIAAVVLIAREAWTKRE